MRFFYLCCAHGEKRLTHALYKYRPGGIRALAILLCRMAEEEAHKAYFASGLWSLIQYASMGKSTFPTWSEAFPSAEREEPLTAKEIKEKVVRDLMKQR